LVTPVRYHEFFLATAGVAGALTGLLFVAISVAPERLLAEDAALLHRVRASAALTAFGNTLTVSLFALVPDITLGWPAVSVAVVGLLFVAGSAMSLLRARRSHPQPSRETGFLTGLTVTFGLQLWFGLRLAIDKGDSGALDGIAILVIVCFLIGIARAWELIGGPSFGLLGQIRQARRDRS
jgi:hypothetical protein